MKADRTPGGWWVVGPARDDVPWPPDPKPDPRVVRIVENVYEQVSEESHRLGLERPTIYFIRAPNKQLGAYVTGMAEPPRILVDVRGFFWVTRLRPAKARREMFRTLVHELGHAYLDTADVRDLSEEEEDLVEAHAIEASARRRLNGDLVMLAKTLSQAGDIDVTGWWMSEKLDGVRAYWNGHDLRSRRGNVIAAPAWFKKMLPRKEHLDGELWKGRRPEDFDFVSGHVRRKRSVDSEAWRKIKYLVFDMPSHDGPFEQRQRALRDLVRKTGSPNLRFVKQTKVKGPAHLAGELARIEKLGGEGVMLRAPRSPYVRGRSAKLLKVKSFKDAEGVVVGYVPGEGRHTGRLGALTLEMEDGVRFGVGTGFADGQREWSYVRKHFPLGTNISIKYGSLTKDGVPRFPVFYRVREDEPDGVAKSRARNPPWDRWERPALVVYNTNHDRVRRLRERLKEYS